MLTVEQKYLMAWYDTLSTAEQDIINHWLDTDEADESLVGLVQRHLDNLLEITSAPSE
jgi:hypothetical protein